VRRAHLGGPDVSTVIRAEIPGTAVLRGDVPAPAFEKVDGYRFVYAAQLDRAPQAVLEHHTLAFAAGATLSNSRDLFLRNCTFSGPAHGLHAEGVENLKVTHSVFAGVPMHLANATSVTMSGNIYANARRPAVRLDAAGAVRYSDYNSYQNAAACWEVGGATWSLADLQPRHGRYSQTLAPEFALEKGVPRLKNRNRFQSLGPRGTALGIHHEYDAAPKALGLVGPLLHSVSDTTANIEPNCWPPSATTPWADGVFT